MKKNIKKIIYGLFALAIINPFQTLAMTKTETIYSNLNYDGSVSKTIINTHLSNLNKGEVVDYSNLDNIKNLNGNEKFSRDSEKLVWKSTGKDIYYEGKINNELPISITAKYYLDGVEVNPTKIKGKKGDIKVVFNLKNNQYDYNYGLYVPYVVSITTTFNNKNNSNYNITNGKCVSMGDKTITEAIAAPGLYYNTHILEFNSLDEVVLTYTTTKFEKNDYYFVITPKLLEDVDLERLNNLDSKLNDVNTLKNGVNQLESGSLEISNGSLELSNGLDELNNGIKSALDGSEQLVNGLSILNDGSKSLVSLNDLVDRLYATYNSNNQLLSDINSGVSEQQLIDGINSATVEKTNLENSLNQVNAFIASLEQGEALGVLTDEQKVQLDTLRGQKVQLEEGIAKYEQGITDAQNNLTKLPMAAVKISGANEVISQVLCGLLNVSSFDYVNDDTINMFKSKISTLVGGVNSLYQGSVELNNGLGKIYEGSNKLTEGSKKLSDGTKTLNEGVKKLNDEGISKLVELSNTVKGYSNKASGMVNLSKEYSGYGSNNSNNTVFIYKLSTKK